jgi:hypothetical protein
MRIHQTHPLKKQTMEEIREIVAGLIELEREQTLIAQKARI